MTTLELASLIMSAEFALASAVILFVVRRRQHLAAATQDSQAAELKSAIQGELPSRRESLTKLFQANAQLKGRKLTTTVDLFLAREQAFYDAMMNIHLNREGKSLQDIPDELRKVLNPWVELQADANEDVAILGDLRAENTELSEQLQNNKAIIERLLEEYDSTFNKFQHGDATAEAEDEETLEDQSERLLSPELPEEEEDLDSVQSLDEDDEQIVVTPDDSEPEELADLFDSRP